MTELERWKPIEGYEGLYEISDWGRLKSCINGNNVILKPAKTKSGYLNCILCDGKTKKNYLLHRLVAQAFIPNPKNLPCVNHLTECKTFNHYTALEWVSYKENITYGTLSKRMSEKQTNNPKISRKINQYSLYGEFIREWPSSNEIKRTTGFHRGNITECCLGKRKTAYGFKWSYAV